MVFQIGLSALRSSQFGLDVISQNIANASTPGYHRQNVHFEALNDNIFQQRRIGSGVRVQDLERLVVAMTSDYGMPPGCLFTAMRLSRARLGEATAARVSMIIDQRREAFKVRVERALELGEVDSKFSAEFAARYLDAQLTTVLVQMATGEPAEEVRAQALVALRALLPRE